MPKRNKKCAFRRKRKVTNAQRRYNQAVIRMPTILPDRIVVNLLYRESATFTNSTGFGSRVFSMNSIYDPNVTGGGHQPLGYDQWGSFYQQYEVKSSKIKSMVLPPSLTCPVRYVVYPSTTSSTVTSSRNASEQAYAKTTVVNNTVMTKYNVLTHNMSILKLEGRNTASINFTAPFGASPTLERYWHCVLFSLDDATDISSILVDFEIIYRCVLFNRYNLNESS